MTHPPAPDFSEDDFEFDDPELGGTLSKQVFNLSDANGQEALIQHLGRMQGVQGIMISRPSGEVLREKAVRDSRSLSSVMAATAMLFGKRGLRLMSVDLGTQTVCMTPLGSYLVAVVAGSQVNIGRLLAEMEQLEVSA